MNNSCSFFDINFDILLQTVEYFHRYHINTWIKLFQLVNFNHPNNESLCLSYLYLLRKRRYILTENEITRLNQYLIKSPIEVDRALNYATKFGYINIIRCLVSYDIDINIDYNGLFQWSAFNGRLEVLKYFLENNLNIDIHVNNNYAFRITTEHSQSNSWSTLDERRRAKKCLKYLKIFLLINLKVSI